MENNENLDEVDLQLLEQNEFFEAKKAGRRPSNIRLIKSTNKTPKVVRFKEPEPLTSESDEEVKKKEEVVSFVKVNFNIILQKYFT